MTKWSEKENAVRKLERNGKVDPLDLISAARDPNHPCHEDFTWDVNQAAAERWRDQARSIIRQCRFDVVYEDVTSPVVQYVSSTDKDSDVFVSLPKTRSKTKVSIVLLAELRMLSGLANRVYGIALSKQNIVGADLVSRLRMIRDTLAEIKTVMEE